jgi:hypothetical protein
MMVVKESFGWQYMLFITDNPAMREIAANYGYQPQDTYILFELTVESAFSTIYSDTGEPIRKRWKG